MKQGFLFIPIVFLTVNIQCNLFVSSPSKRKIFHRVFPIQPHSYNHKLGCIFMCQFKMSFLKQSS